MPWPRLDAWWMDIKNVVWPQLCRQCGARILTEDNLYFCPACWARSARVELPYCIVCGRPHDAAIGFGVPFAFPCAGCRSAPPAHIRRIRGAALYEDAIGHAIRLFKFEGKVRLCPALCELMEEFAAGHLDCSAYDALVPVPLHRVRLRDRGYNQSQLLAEGVLARFPGAVLDLSLERIRPTRTQSRLHGAGRRGNVRGAFAVRGDSIAGKRVLLIDDVVTTATTVSECARALRKAGAAEVDVFCAALATLHRHAMDG